MAINDVFEEFTQVSDLQANPSPKQVEAENNPNLGNTTYSTYTCESLCEKYIMVWGNSPSICDIYNIDSNGVISYRERLYHFPPLSSTKIAIGESTGPRWGGTKDSPKLFYCYDTALWYYHLNTKQTVLVFDFGFKVRGWQYSGPDNSNRFFAIGIAGGTNFDRCVEVALFDYLTNKIYRYIREEPTGIKDWGISPCGNYLKAGKIFKIADIMNGIILGESPSLGGGHGGWAWIDKNHCGWIHIESSNDQLELFDPETNQVTYLQSFNTFNNYPDMTHVASIFSEKFIGWTLVSNASADIIHGENSIYFIKLDPYKTPGVPHPSRCGFASGTTEYEKAKVDFQNATIAEKPVVIKVADSINQYNRTYFSEGHCSFGQSGRCYLVANRLNQDNLEVYYTNPPQAFLDAIAAQNLPITDPVTDPVPGDNTNVTDPPVTPPAQKIVKVDLHITGTFTYE